MLKRICLILTFSLPLIQLCAQDFGVNNLGTAFYFALGQNYTTVTTLSFQVAATEDTKIWVHTRLGTEEYFVSSDTPRTITLPPNMSTVVNQKENKGIYVQSQKKISIIASNLRGASSDATLLKPIDALGSIYTVNRYIPPSGSGGNTNRIMVVATTPNTWVVFRNASTNQVIQTELLDSLETYTFNYSGAQTVKVESLHGEKISVFYTNDCVFVGSCPACDHLYTQVISDDMLGKKYVAIPISRQNGGYVLSILAIEDNTLVHINHAAPIQLNKGDAHILDVNSAVYTQIEANTRISVFQLLKGINCHQPRIGDPACAQLSAVEQLTNNAKFVTLSSPIITEHHITLLVPKHAKHLLKINGANAPLWHFSPEEPFNEYVLYNQHISAGMYQIECEAGFIGYLHGLGHAESYFTLLNASFNLLVSPPIYYPSEICLHDTAFITFSDISQYKTMELDSPWQFINDSVAFLLHSQTGAFEYPFAFQLNINNRHYTETIRIRVNPLPSIWVQDTQVCINQYHMLIAHTDTVISSVFWVDPKQDTLYTDSLQVFYSGTYFQFALSNKGCINHDSFELQFLDNSPFELSPLHICVEEETALELDRPDTLEPHTQAFWQFSDGTVRQGLNPWVHFSSPGSYDVIVSTENALGCKDTVEMIDFIVVHSNPTAQIEGAAIRDSMGYSLYRFNSVEEGQKNYRWHVNQQEVSNSASFTYAFEELGTYTLSLWLKNEWDCVDSTEVNWEVIALYKVYIPNIFSPNKDGLNEVFMPYGLEYALEYELQIYNRWGALLFRSTDLQTGWDGTSGGEPVPDGVYVYKINVIDSYNKATEYRGTVQLIR